MLWSEIRNRKPETGSRTFVFWFLVSGFCLLLSGCGFQPLHAQKKLGGSYEKVEIANIPDQNGQFLRNLLIDKIYGEKRPENAPYLLTLSPVEKKTVEMGIRKDADATRAQVEMRARLTLAEKATGKVLLERYLLSVGAYNIVDNQFATLISREHVDKTILMEMADDVVTEINLYFSP